MIRVTVIGSGGQLGSDLVAALRDTEGYQVTALTRDDIDVTNPDSVRAALQHARSDIVVNCAACVRVDDCEDHPDAAVLANAVGAVYVARGCRESNALSVHVSRHSGFG